MVRMWELNFAMEMATRRGNGVVVPAVLGKLNAINHHMIVLHSNAEFAP